MFVTIQAVPKHEVLALPDRPEPQKANCIKCSLNGGETLNFSIKSILEHSKYHTKTDGEYMSFVIDANFAPIF